MKHQSLTLATLSGFASQQGAGDIISWLSLGARQGHYEMDVVVDFLALQNITFRYIPYSHGLLITKVERWASKVLSVLQNATAERAELLHRLKHELSL